MKFSLNSISLVVTLYMTFCPWVSVSSFSSTKFERSDIEVWFPQPGCN